MKDYDSELEIEHTRETRTDITPATSPLIFAPVAALIGLIIFIGVALTGIKGEHGLPDAAACAGVAMMVVAGLWLLPSFLQMFNWTRETIEPILPAYQQARREHESHWTVIDDNRWLIRSVPTPDDEYFLLWCESALAKRTLAINAWARRWGGRNEYCKFLDVMIDKGLLIPARGNQSAELTDRGIMEITQLLEQGLDGATPLLEGGAPEMLPAHTRTRRHTEKKANRER
jgi:hypothetical protein